MGLLDNEIDGLVGFVGEGTKALCVGLLGNRTKGLNDGIMWELDIEIT